MEILHWQGTQAAPMKAASPARQPVFRGDSPAPDPPVLKPETPPAKRRLTLREQVGKYTGFIAAGFQFFGGLSLVVSSFLPQNKQKQPDLPPAATPQSVTAELSAAFPQIGPQEAAEAMASVREFLNKMGWTMVSNAYILECISAAGMGFRDKQPSMVLGNAACLAMAPMFMVDPSVSLRASFYVACALFMTGFANKLKNEMDPTQPKREMDMRFLTDYKGWQKDLQDEVQKQLGPDANPKVVRAWLEEALKMLKFSWEDQVISVKASAQAVHSMVTRPKAFMKSFHKALSETRQYMGGKREDLPQELTQSLAVQEQMSAMLVYAGSVPILFLGGSMPLLASLGSKLYGGSAVLSNVSIFTVGAHRQDALGKAIMVGIPLKILGGSFMETDAGYGLDSLGASPVCLYYADQNKEVPPDSHT